MTDVQDKRKERIICWFSCGCASATATKMVLDKYRNNKNYELLIAYIYLKNEHEDSMRFLKECETWFNYPISIFRDKKYDADVDVVVEKTKYMSGVYGANCSRVLKKAVRIAMQRTDDIHVFGMTIEEKRRIDRLIDAEPNMSLLTPLIDSNITKDNCYAVIKQAGIELPVMYKLGYNNNNCIGCLKASSVSYWNKIREDFPDVFNKRAEQERLLNVALCKMSKRKFKRLHPNEYNKMAEDHKKGLVNWVEDNIGGLRIPLRYLPLTKIERKELDIGDCGFFCETKSEAV